MSEFLNDTCKNIANSYFYIFFAPPDEVREYAESTQPGGLQSTPPKYEWGGYKGYLLGLPDFAFIFRYRVNNPNWPGNPENAPCYPIALLNQPITNIGDGWLPEIYGDNFDSFAAFENASSIGPIVPGGDW
mmetsp:Transcript_47434/g.60917  ORF Transcript_47434/g.60917 Transcript_47434/m.60917 type:complete len:131 (-) Transcript_47434:61-453(-)